MWQIVWHIFLNNRFKVQLYIKILITIIVFFCTGRLFYLQINNPEMFPSDTTAHMSFAIDGKGYSYLMPVLGGLMRIFEPHENLAVALFEAGILILTLFALYFELAHLQIISKFQAFLISVVCIFLSSLYIPFLQPMFYKGGIVTQPWHNITYMFMRLFAIFTLGKFISLINVYKKRFILKDWMGITIPLFFSTAIKSNFLIGFSLTLLLFLIVDYVNDRSLKGMIQCVKLGSTVLPAIIILWLQSQVLYNPVENSGIAIVFLTSNFFSLGLWGTFLKLIRGLIFAIIVITYNKSWKRKDELFIIVQYIISLLLAIFLIETGTRESHGNFYWGLYSSGYFFMALTFTKFISNLNSIIIERSISKRNLLYLVTGCILFFMHIISGIMYFILLSIGGKEYAF